MAAHIVKCLFCGKQFDAQPDGKDVIWFKPRANRYAHVECGKQNEANKTQDEKDYERLYYYVKEQQKDNFDYVKFKKIVEAWHKDYNFTYNGMYYSLIYFYEVKKNSKQKLASQRAGTGTYDATKSRSIEIEPPAAKQRVPKLFNLDMEDDDEE